MRNSGLSAGAVRPARGQRDRARANASTRFAALATLVAVVGAGVALSQVERTPPTVPTALASMPAETLTASVTDWSRVREALAGRGGTAAMLERAYDSDASAVSVLGDMTAVMERRYGWSVLDARWEALAQSRRGAALVVQLPPDFAMGVVREGLGELGYLEPFESDGVWRGGGDLVAGIDPSLTPLMAHAAVLDDTRRVVFSDNAAYAARTAAVIEGSRPALAQSEAVAAVADNLEGAVAGVVHAGDRGCAVMGFGKATPADQAAARRRVAAVGGIGRFSAVGMALLPGTDPRGLRRAPLVVAMHFDDGSAASAEAERRATLAVGDAPLQGGTYQSRFTVEGAEQRGGDVVLRLRPREADAQLLSDLNAGGLLFASCG
jgi:hypothetical protein